MISATLQFLQSPQKQSQNSPSNQEFFFEQIGEPTSFRETLLSSAMAQDFSFSRHLDEGPNTDIEFHLSPETIPQNVSARPFADRFDMTGIFGHSHVISDGSTSDAASVAFTAEPENILSHEYDKQEGKTALEMTVLKSSSEEKGLQPVKNIKASLQRRIPASRSTMQLLNSDKTSLNTADLGQLLDADAMSTSLNSTYEANEGVNEIRRSSVKSPLHSLLNTTSSHAQSNQLMVALQTLENGLRLYARVQNMDSQERAELRNSVKALLAENGFFEAEIVIDEFRAQIDSKVGRGT